MGNSGVQLGSSGAGGGGGGSGTVSPNNGVANELAIYTAAGGSTVVSADATLVDNGTRLVYSGTTGVQVPAGASASPSLALGGTTDGFYEFGTHQIGAVSNGYVAGNFNGSDGLTLNNATFIGWAASGTGTSGDVVIGRVTSSVLQVGLGAASPETGFLRTGGTSRVTSDITLSTSATTLATFSLNGTVAKAWAFRGDIMWAVTAGTTPTLSFGVNSSQTPTGTTNVAATILTTNTGTQTNGTASLSASGALNVLTSPTLTPSATIFQASIFGVVLIPGSIASFTITATGAGTGFAGAVKAGSTFYFY